MDDNLNQNNNSQQPNAQPAVQAAVGLQPSAIKLDNIDSGYLDFMKKKWWLVTILAISMLILSYISIILVVIVLMFVFLYFKKQYENNLFSAFAAANGFEYFKNSPMEPKEGLIFNLGYNKRFNDVVIGQYEHLPLSLFLYTYCEGYGRDKHDITHAVLEVSFDCRLPAFVLRQHKFLSFLDGMGEALGSNGYTEKINLEGNFNDYFQVYIKPATEIDVLSILSPDVMELFTGLNKYEVELTTNGNLYIYCRDYITEKQDLIDIYSIVEVIVPKLDRFTKREEQLQATNETNSL